MIRLATDQDWLHKATKELSKYWRLGPSGISWPVSRPTGRGKPTVWWKSFSS